MAAGHGVGLEEMAKEAGEFKMIRLARQDSSKIKHFLKPLSSQELINVGMQLGVNTTILSAMSPESQLDGMVDRWLENWLKGVMEGTNDTCMGKLTSALEGIDRMDIISKMFNEWNQTPDSQPHPQFSSLAPQLHSTFPTAQNAPPPQHPALQLPRQPQYEYSSHNVTSSSRVITTPAPSAGDTSTLHLDISHFNTLYTTLCKSVSTQWEHVGSFLGVDPHTVELIARENTGDMKACFRNMLKAWLRGINPIPTKAKILQVLRVLDFHKEADTLEQRLL